MEFVVCWYECFSPFFMKQVMDIAIGCRTPEKARKKSKVIIQPVCNANKNTAENKK
jgi:hypothetical protein